MSNESLCGRRGNTTSVFQDDPPHFIITIHVLPRHRRADALGWSKVVVAKAVLDGPGSIWGHGLQI